MIDSLFPIIPSLPGAQSPQRRDLKAVAQDFAALFLHTLLRHAFRPQEFPGGGPEQEAFYDQLSWEYARLLARRNDAGISKLILRSLERNSQNNAREK